MMLQDYKDSVGLWRKSKTTNYKQMMTVSGRKWRDMSSRCDTGGSAQVRRKTYTGCSMSKNFKDFQYFVEWHRAQTGYGLDGYCLDKDLLLHGNKEYSENVCVLIPQELNCFLTDSAASRGEFPIGVSYRKDCGKYTAHVTVCGLKKYLGMFISQEEAYLAYKDGKEAEAQRWEGRLRGGEFAVDGRVILALKNWRLNE